MSRDRFDRLLAQVSRSVTLVMWLNCFWRLAGCNARIEFDSIPDLHCVRCLFTMLRNGASVILCTSLMRVASLRKVLDWFLLLTNGYIRDSLMTQKWNRLTNANDRIRFCGLGNWSLHSLLRGRLLVYCNICESLLLTYYCTLGTLRHRQLHRLIERFS